MSSYVNFTGILELNAIFDANAYCTVFLKLRQLGYDYDDVVKVLNNSIGKTKIEFYDNGNYTDEVIEIVVNTLKDWGYKVNGVVSYYGDYEGKVFVEDNKITILDKEDCWKMDATVDELLEVLKQRWIKEAKNYGKESQR